MKIPTLSILNQKPMPGSKDCLVGYDSSSRFYRIKLDSPRAGVYNDSEAAELRQRKFDQIFLWTLLTVVVLCAIAIFASIGAAIFSHFYAASQLRVKQQATTLDSPEAYVSGKVVGDAGTVTLPSSFDVTTINDKEGEGMKINQDEGNREDALVSDANSVVLDVGSIIKEIQNSVELAASDSNLTSEEIFRIQPEEWTPNSGSSASSLRDSETRKHDDQESRVATVVDNGDDGLSTVVNILKLMDAMMDDFITDTRKHLQSFANRHLSFLDI